jgi:hypothetical protein
VEELIIVTIPNRHLGLGIKNKVPEIGLEKISLTFCVLPITRLYISKNEPDRSVSTSTELIFAPQDIVDNSATVPSEAVTLLKVYIVELGVDEVVTVKLTCDPLTEVKCGTISSVAVITGNIELDNSLLKRTDRLYIVFSSVG